MNIIDLFLAHAAETPDKPAIVFGDSLLSYAQVADRTGRLCGLLRSMGVSEGDCLLVALDNGIEFTLTMLAAAELGAMLAPVATSMPVVAMQRSLGATGARFVIASNPVCRRLLDSASGQDGRLSLLVTGAPVAGCRHFSELDQSESSYRLGSHGADAQLDYLLTMTSGSTGDPKPITLSQAGKIRRSLDGARDLYGLDNDDVIITSTPMYHSLGFRLALLPLLIGATAVILPRFSPKGWIEAVNSHAVSFAIMVSSHLELIAQWLSEHPTPLPSLMTMVSSSALLRPEIKQRCIDLFDCAFHECYGASEVGIVTNLAPADCGNNLASVGKALDYVDLVIMDEHGQAMPHGTIGEIACRTATAFSGYYRRPDATAASMRSGFFCTGDMGHVDADGYLYLAGRKKDIIIVGGSNVYPEDVEAVLREAPGVEDCAVIGVPDRYFGEAALAVITTGNTQADLRHIKAFCAQRLADFQLPQAYEIVDKLPRTALGKIQRQVLRDRYANYDATADLRLLMRRGA